MLKEMGDGGYFGESRSRDKGCFGLIEGRKEVM